MKIASRAVIITILIIAAGTSAMPPATLELRESRYTRVHVGRPGRDHTMELGFHSNKTRFTFSPFTYSVTATGSTEILYIGTVPVRTPYTYATGNSILPLGTGSVLWNMWANYTLSPHEIAFGDPEAPQRLSVDRCGMVPPPGGIVFDPSTEQTTLPPELYDAEEFIVRIGSCDVMISRKDMHTLTADGVEVDMRQRGASGSKAILGRPVIARHFVIFRDMRQDRVLVGLSAEVTDLQPLQIFGAIGISMLVCAVALASLYRPGINNGLLTWLNGFTIVACFVAAVISISAPGALDLAELRFRGLLPATPGLAIPLVFVAAVTMTWGTPWMVSSGLATLWLIALWDVGDFSGGFYRFLWPTVAAEWQATLALVRGLGVVDVLLATFAVAYAMAYTAWPACVATFGTIKFASSIALIVYFCAAIVIPVELIYTFMTLRKARQTPFVNDPFIPIARKIS